MRTQILSITRKELSHYFGSPLAMIFLGVFLAAVLFIFFSVETFFVRNVADVRPMFRWMPLLLIFLLAALTMRQWSEEQRSGTQELLLTLPVRPWSLVLGKFLAVMALIALALALTLPLTLSVALMGNLDWGPVIGGYLAALLMAAAYAAIGLFVSSRTDNQIVALILTVLVGGVFYLVGTPGVTKFVGGVVSQILWALGTGSRFESIQRGVIDLRDLVYYLSLTSLFLMLNTLSLDSNRWSPHQTSYRRNWLITGALLGVNIVLLNAWLFPLRGLRLDLTQDHEYTLSRTTKDLLNSVQEPLLIRAYISQKTHPLLQPLAPRIDDMLREYAVNSNSKVTAEVVDPASDPELEAEANQTYGIRPTPFQVAGRYEASVINAYFDILIRYGDQNVTLSFPNLIEVQARPDNTIDVTLGNLEYELTSAIKKVVFGFQSVDAVLAALDEPAQLTLYVSSRTIPSDLAQLEPSISAVAEKIQADSGGKLQYKVVDLDSPNSGVTASQLSQTYGIRPIPVDIFGSSTFFAHMVLQNGDQTQIIYPPTDLSDAAIRSDIESALKRTATGFLKEVGVVIAGGAPNPALGGQANPLTQYQSIQDQLGQNYTVRSVDLTSPVPANIDVLLVVGNTGSWGESELYALDQYLMRGGSLILATNFYELTPDQFTGGLSVTPSLSAELQKWLAFQGINLTQGLVMDLQNQPFPVPVTRNVGGFQVQEIQAINYPFFVDVRSSGMNSKNPILSDLSAVTLNWASPVEIDASAQISRTAETLLSSSPRSWLDTSGNILPDLDLYPDQGFAVGSDQKSYPLAVALQGQFKSYYSANPPQTITNTLGLTPVSPESSRLVVFGSSTFIEDDILRLSLNLSQDISANSLQLVQNAVDWSVEDLDLLSIRGRGAASRLLNPMTEQIEARWEIGNYVVGLAAIIVIFLAWRARQRAEQPMALVD